MNGHSESAPVNRAQQALAQGVEYRLSGPASSLVKPCEARRAPQLQREGALASGPGDRLSEPFLGVRCALHEEQFALPAQHLSEKPPFLSALRASQRLVDRPEALRNLPGPAETCSQFSEK